MRKSILVASLLMGSLVLGGCQNNRSTAKSSDSSSKTTTVSSSSKKQAVSSSTTKTASTYTLNWNAAKQKQMNTFMQQFGQKMNQSYQPVDKSTTVKWFNHTLSVLMQNNQIVVNGTTTKVAWFPTKGSATATNIVASYVDSSNHILYLMTETKDGQNQVLVTQEDVNADGLLVTKPTTNQSLTSDYQAAMAGKNAPASNSTADSKTTAAFSFPSEYIGSWYAYNDDGSESTITFTTNTITTATQGDTDPVETFHSDSEMTANDKTRIKEGDGGSANLEDAARRNWYKAATTTVNGKEMLQVGVWYAYRGNQFSYYHVQNDTINGQSVPTLYLYDEQGAQTGQELVKYHKMGGNQQYFG
ncbi:hypothetical protein IV38_GL001675 [Lactobacillus selangorensis]|uniref:DUF4767 domain-containing protein n=1 Tax=Lactobacillus selangorensis TaxID=81857 RepID=A0A0R2FZL8_9LACO|nr:DUF4767 domain-containing protein [Lactobacillus selangorensis]KRN28221.1 hypothetical protein IV38_GL001675 [Lactobacillus selangorensis]KRN30903.1 hypothetical protein IV40_GL001540 [Lactobacillus selangorensis]